MNRSKKIIAIIILTLLFLIYFTYQQLQQLKGEGLSVASIISIIIYLILLLIFLFQKSNKKNVLDTDYLKKYFGLSLKNNNWYYNGATNDTHVESFNNSENSYKNIKETIEEIQKNPNTIVKGIGILVLKDAPIQIILGIEDKPFCIITSLTEKELSKLFTKFIELDNAKLKTNKGLALLSFNN